MAETFSVELPEAGPEVFSVDLPEAPRETPGAVTETALRLGTGMAAFPVALGAGIAGMALPGESGQGARYMNRIQEALTYQPRGAGGIMLSKIVEAPFRWLGEKAQQAGEKVTDITGSPAAGAVTQSTIQMAPALVSMAARPLVKKAIASRDAKQLARASRSLERDTTITRAQQEGYVMPSESLPGRALSSIGGKEVLRQDMAWQNQQVTNNIARREAGLPSDVPINIKNLQDARYRIEAPYRAVADLSPTAKQALNEMKVARAGKQAWYKRYGVSRHPDDLQKAKALEVEERFWDTMIEQEAVKLGRPGLPEQLRAARVASAKNHTIERALNPSTGDVSARVIGQIYAKQKGEGMTGGIETIGRFANGPGWEVTRDVSRVGVPGGQHGQAVEAAAGAVVGGFQGGPSGMLAGAGIPLARIPARQLALSRMLQPRPRYSPSLSFSLADIGTRRPEVAALTAGLTVPPYRAPEEVERPPWAMQWPEE